MAETFQQLIEWLRGIHYRLEHWYLLMASVLTLASGFSKGPLRFTALLLAVVLFLLVIADFARSRLEKDTSYTSLQGPPDVVPVTPVQVGFAIVLAAIYTGMIAGGLRFLFFPAGLGILVILPCTFILSFLAAWRNVRMWYRHAMDYEQALKEDEGQSHRLRIPPVR